MILANSTAEGLVVVRLLRFFAAIPPASRAVHAADFPVFDGMKRHAVVVVDPAIMSGEPCFAGTRVPVRALLDDLEGGETLGEFLEQYPTVSRKQAVSFSGQKC
jgi:uncharacterized protein (DUF433 family)